MHFETVIGLEVHVELKQTQNVLSITGTFWSEPNSNTNVIDLAYPGVLPVVNRRLCRLGYACINGFKYGYRYKF